MKRTKSFLISASALAMLNIILRCISVSFNAYVSAKLGAEGMGLFTLTMSVYGLAVTVATSGVNLAAVRLTAERTALVAAKGCTDWEYRRCIRHIMLSCILYAALFSFPTAGILYASSTFIGENLLSDARTILSLKALAISLPAISITSAINGYFTGVRKIHKNAALGALEQGMKILFTATALTVAIPPLLDRVEYSCLAVVGGAVAADVMTLIFSAVAFSFDKKKPKACSQDFRNIERDAMRFGKKKIFVSKKSYATFKDAALISLPVALGAYARQGLSTAEHLAIPWGMKKSGLAAGAALASYGALHGMVFPLILFPSAVISSFAGLLVPEVAEFKAMGKNEHIKRSVGRVYSSALAFSIICAAIFFAFSNALGKEVYGSVEAARMIRAMAPLVPIMYLDTAVDGMLKGLGEQVHSMKINIIDSASSLALVLLMVPRYGIVGYIISVYFCETLNMFLSVIRLKKVTGIGIDFIACVLAPISAAALSVSLAKFAFDRAVSFSTWTMIVASVVLYLPVYFFLIKSMRGKDGKKLSAYNEQILKTAVEKELKK